MLNALDQHFFSELQTGLCVEVRVPTWKMLDDFDRILIHNTIANAAEVIRDLYGLNHICLSITKKNRTAAATQSAAKVYIGDAGIQPGSLLRVDYLAENIRNSSKDYDGTLTISVYAACPPATRKEICSAVLDLYRAREIDLSSSPWKITYDLDSISVL